MKDKISQAATTQVVDDKATEKIKKRAQDWGLIVNAGVGKAPQQPVKKVGSKK